MKKKINIIIFLFILFFGLFSFFFKKDTSISIDERRYLKTRKDIEFNEEFSSNFESYLLDQFPMRSEFRKIKSISSYKIFNKLENNDTLLFRDSLIKINNNYDLDKVRVSVKRLESLRKNLFMRNKVYFVLVPDKGDFYEDFSSMTPNYEDIKSVVKEEMNRATFIDIENYLSLEDYYKTDTHWSQDNLLEVSKIILESMNNEYEETTYIEKEIEDFLGVLLSYSYIPFKSESIKYLTNEEIEKCIVFNYETNKESKVYDLKKLEDEKSLDKYDIFLSGASALLKITNEDAISDKTLIIFRDSFGSSITPLFIHNYKEIYLVDIRYIDSSLIKNFLTIKGDEDILFLYSMSLLEIPGNFK